MLRQRMICELPILLEMMPVSITEVLCQHVKPKLAFP